VGTGQPPGKRAHLRVRARPDAKPVPTFAGRALGSDRRGYEFVAPLATDGRIDAQLWGKYREHCGVRRFWAGEDDEIGRLVRKPGGAEHARWVFDYDETAEDDDEAGYRFGDHAFRNGEYVSIRGDDGEMHTFQVVSVEPAT
jgi:hypothetical protein